MTDHDSMPQDQGEVIRQLQGEVERLKAALKQGRSPDSETNALMATIAELAPVGIYIYQDGTITYANRRAFETIGLAPSDENRDRLLSFLTPSDEKLVRQRAKARISGTPDIPTMYEVQMVRSDGEPRWLLIRAALISYQGRPATLAIGLDITERRLMEEELRVSKAKLEAIFESTSDYILLSDHEGKPVYFNSAYAAVMKRLLGIDMKPGLQPHTLLDEKEKAQWAEYHRRVLSGEQFTEDFSFPDPDGSMLHFEHSFYPVTDDGRIVGFCEFTHDITRRRQAEERLSRIQQEHNDQLQRVAGGLAHEIYNTLFPASAALLNIQKRLEADKTTADPDYLRILDLAKRSLSRTIELTESVGLFSRLESLTSDEPTCLREVVDEILEQHHMQFAEHGIRFDLEMPSNLYVSCPRAHLHSMIDNLVVNGANAMREVQRRNLLVFASCSKGVCTIRISDSGAGIADKHIEQIFEPFFTTRPGVGSGLGLAIVKRIVDLCQGKLSVESEVGKGTTFEITLPCILK